MDYDAELQRYEPVLRDAWAVRPGDHVLDIGCGSARTTREAARIAVAGRALGIDISEAAVARGRDLARDEGLRNVEFECADAQDYSFAPESFDLAISRCGTMFFDDPVAAFTNIARALRPGGRLVMMVWQAGGRNEWEVGIRRALAAGGPTPAGEPIPAGGPGPGDGPDPFSLGEPAAVEAILRAAGFAGIDLTEAARPVFYGPDVPAALAWVRGFTSTDRALRRLAPDAAARALDRVRDLLAAHASDDGVWFDSRAWIVTARRA